MTPLAFTITDAGKERLALAQLGDPVDLTLATFGLSDAAFVAAPTLTALPGEHRRLATVSGAHVGDGVMHLVLRDEGAAAYGVRGIGLFLADDTLFAAYAQADRLVEKSAATTFHFALDVQLDAVDAGAVTFGDTNFLQPPATTTSKGVVELATEAEADAGTAGVLVITAALLRRAVLSLTSIVDALRNYVDDQVDYLTNATAQAIAGIASRTIYGGDLVKGGGDLTANRTLTVVAASGADVDAGSRSDIAVTPGGLRAAMPFLAQPSGYARLPGGVILQWGQYRGSSTTEEAITVAFPIAFPNGCFMRQATGFIAGASSSKDLWVQIVGAGSLTDLTVQYQQATGDRAIDGFDWLAIGN